MHQRIQGIAGRAWRRGRFRCRRRRSFSIRWRRTRRLGRRFDVSGARFRSRHWCCFDLSGSRFRSRFKNPEPVPLLFRFLRFNRCRRCCSGRRFPEFAVDHRSGDTARNPVVFARNVRPGFQHVIGRVPSEGTVTGSIALGIAFTRPAHQVVWSMILIPNESFTVFGLLVLPRESCAGKY
jgi:hypothetical protein